MFESLKSIITGVKEGVLEAGAKTYLNGKIQNFGTITNLQIEPRLKRIAVEVSLKGEAVPVTVSVTSYEVVSAAEASFLIPKHFEASREWLASALNEYVANRRFELPAPLAGVLR